jgi:hypothetical protein
VKSWTHPLVLPFESSRCGTHLFVTAPNAGYYGISAGAIEDEHSAELTMDSELFIDTKPDFYSFVGDRKRMTEAEFLDMISGGCEQQANAAVSDSDKARENN